MKPPLVTICTPVYNGERYLRESIESSVDQTWPAVEVVVVDDASTDSTPGVLKAFGDSIRVVTLRTNGGYANAVNTAIRSSRGDFLVFNNADDRLERDMVQRHAEALSSFKEASITYSDFLQIDAEGEERNRVRTPDFPNHHALRRAIAKSCFLSLGSAMVRRRVFDTVGLLDVENSHSADWEFWTRALAVFPARHLPGFLARYRVHGQQNSLQSNAMERCRQLTRARVARSYPFAIWFPSWISHHRDVWSEIRWNARTANRGLAWAAGAPMRDLVGFAKALGRTTRWAPARLHGSSGQG